MKNRQKTLTVVYGILLLILYGVIFALSEQDGDASGGLSMGLSERCTDVLESISGEQWDSSRERTVAEELEKPLRKAAHFTEYACMGALVWLLWELWVPGRRLLCGITAMWILASAGLDELHQAFVPGRCASLGDVCVDAAGAIAGTLLMLLVRRMFCGKRPRG